MKNNGFTLIEVLFSLLIVSVGLITIMSTIKITEKAANQELYKTYAYIILSNTAKLYSKNQQFPKKIIYNNIEYNISTKKEPIRLDKLIINANKKLTDLTQIKLVHIKVEYILNKQNNEITFDIIE